MRSVSVRSLASSICASTVGASSVFALTISAVSIGALLVLLDWIRLLCVGAVLWLLAVSEGLWLSLGNITSIGSSEVAGWVSVSALSISTGLLLVSV